MPTFRFDRFVPLLVIALAIGLAACSASSSASADASSDAALRVMSFNIRLNTESDGENAWPHRIEAVERIMQDADVVGVQEALPGMIETLDARLDGWARIGVGRDADGGGEYSAIYYRTDRLELTTGDTFWLSKTPEVPGSKDWDAAITRIATWGTFRDRASGDELTIINTHFDHVGQTAREQSAQLIVDRFDQLAGDGPVVLMGDFNVTPNNPVYPVLTESTGLSDAFLASATLPTGVAGTWNGFGRDEPVRRIDYVFVRGLAVQSFTTRDETIGEVLGTDNSRYPSDHFAVMATVR
ncbi:MAG: endonuclease/exonuclease/phosphatase family protein [Rubricoccaceae bacterium]